MNFKLISLLFLMLAIFLRIPTSHAADPIPFGALQETQLVAISPSGKTIAFRKVNENTDQIAVMSLTERKVLFAVDIKELNPFSLRFISEDLVYLRASSNEVLRDYSSERFELSTGYVLDIPSRKVRQLLKPGDNIYAAQSGLGRIISLSPDKKYAYMPAFVGEPPVSPTYNLLKIDITKNNARDTVHKGKTSTRDYFLDEKGEILAMEEYGAKRDQHKILANKNGKFEVIYAEKTDIVTKHIAGLTEDHKSLVMVMTNEKTKRDAYYHLALNDGAITGPVFSANDADIGGVITDINRTVKGIIYDGFYPKYEFFDRALNKRFADIVAKFPEQSVYLQDYSDNFKHFIIYVEGPNFAGDYFLIEEGKEPVFLVSARPKIPSEAINPIGKTTLLARDGFKIPTLLTIPSASVKNMKNLPAILLPHGGPESHDVIGFDWLAQAFASQGYLVIQPQFRGSSGFGLPHILAGRGQWGKIMQNDLTDSLAALVKKGHVDPKRVCIVGASYGGYAALAGAAFTPDLYRCAVSINGVSDLKQMLRIDRFKYGKDSATVAYWEQQLGGQGEISNSELEAISPKNSAATVKAPVLLLASNKDVIVDPGQSSDMKKALKSADKTVEFVELEGDDHHLSKFATRKKALDATLTFVKKHIQ
ncbi:MAG: hypothetical protein RL497_1391 [Pseudomonadota bacterium]